MRFRRTLDSGVHVRDYVSLALTRAIRRKSPNIRPPPEIAFDQVRWNPCVEPGISEATGSSLRMRDEYDSERSGPAHWRRSEFELPKRYNTTRAAQALGGDRRLQSNGSSSRCTRFLVAGFTADGSEAGTSDPRLRAIRQTNVVSRRTDSDRLKKARVE